MSNPIAPGDVFDRTPPHSLEAERSVLGAMLLNPDDAVGPTIEILGDKNIGELFYADAHRWIYKAILAMYQKSVPIDPTTMVEELTRMDKIDAVGGLTYLGDLFNAVPTSANVEYYAKIVLDNALLRRLISTCTFLAGDAYKAKEEVEELLDRAESDIYRLNERRQLSPIHHLPNLLQEGVLRIEKQMQSDGHVTGVPTGFPKLDEMLSGMQPSDMIILAARPSVGKTAFALNIAQHVALSNPEAGVLLFSLEMSKEQLVQRLLCMVGQVDSQRLRSGFLARQEFPKVQQAAAKLRDAKIYIDETPGITVMELRSKARRHAAQHPLDVIVIDYLQLMSGSGRTESRQVEISEISRAIKGIARELQVPVLALSQLSREAEKDDSGVPKLSHLRESGAIEQDADVVMMLSRPPIHKRRNDEDDDSEVVDENIITLHIAKQRNGPTGLVKLYFDKNIQRFRTLTGGGAMEEPPPPAAYEADFDADVYDEDAGIPFDDGMDDTF